MRATQVALNHIIICQFATISVKYELPLQNLVEVVSLRVLDAESLNSLVVSLSYVVSDVLVVVLSCT